jgi:hypothetical protein
MMICLQIVIICHTEIYFNPDICETHINLERQQLIDLLSRHVEEIESVKDFTIWHNHSKANDLLQKTRMLSDKYFSLRFYSVELIGIKFKPSIISSITKAEDFKSAWEDGMIKLLSIARAMRDDAKLTPVSAPPVKFVEDTSKLNQLTDRIKKAETKNQELEEYFSEALEKVTAEKEEYKARVNKIKKWAIFFLLLIFLSIILWSFNSFVKWSWLLNHQKKTALYISFQLLIIFSLLRIVSKNRAIKVADIITAIGVAVLSII